MAKDRQAERVTMKESRTAHKYIQIASPSLNDEEWEALKEPITTGWLTQGPKVAAFEEAFALRHGVPFGIATTSCTTALHLALLAAGVKPGDRVIVPSFTWIATANVVEYCQGVPIFCDSDIRTYNLDVRDLAKKVEECVKDGIPPKAIIAVHIFGLCAEMDEIREIASKYGMSVIEDAACAAGAAYRSKPAGSIGDVGCFSFHPRKIITTGEGGMCTTGDRQMAESIRCLRNHGGSLSEEQRHRSDSPYLLPDFNVLGYNYRMTDLQGAIGLVQLKKLDRLIDERRYWAEHYTSELSNLEWLITPHIPSHCQHSWQAYVCRVDEKKSPISRDALMEYLHKNGVATRPGTHSVHRLGYYASKYNIRPEDYPAASLLDATTITLPLHNRMNGQDYEKVVTLMRSI